jgi:hypothetical protein
VTATRIAPFTQNLQVHPAITTEVLAFATSMMVAAAADKGGPNAA